MFIRYITKKMSQSQYGAVEAETPAAAATPRRGKAVVIALALCVGGALFAVAGPGPSQPVWKSTSVSGAPDNSSLSHFSAMTRPTWRSSGEEPASPRHRAGVASMANAP